MPNPGTMAVGVTDNSSSFELVKLCFSLLEAEGIKAASFGENRWAGGEDVMLDTVMRRVVLEVRRKNSGKRMDKVLKGWG